MSDRVTTVVGLFEAQVMRRPEAIAVQDAAGETLSYAELNARAEALAGALQEKGVRADVPVGLYVERSLEMAVALLGILKAGGAYVPLDPEYPQERLDFIVDDCEMPVVVTQSTLKEFGASFQAELVCVDLVESQTVEGRRSDGASGLVAENLAYVMYTSGSTGKPKGVMVEHRNLVNHCQAVVELFEMTENERVLQFISINFDGSVEEIFPCWAVGGTLVLRPEELSSSVAAFEAFIEKERITQVDLPTAYWHEWVRSTERIPAGLRAVIVGGEKASMELLKRWQERGGKSVRWFNVYGPTETTSCSTVYELDAAWAELKEIPIGSALANTELVIVDDAGERVAAGEAGELWIGGAGVARGYLNRPELTAARFVENKWGEGRLYRTGDRVRELASGALEFLGRVDFQVKIRGYRIEPDEIAAVLERHPAVGSAVVTAREDLSAEKVLAAYVICEEPVKNGALAAFLKGELPEYMVPHFFKQLDAFPMTPNGKVDRQALPKPEAIGADGARSEKPTSAQEISLAEIWCELLGLESVGVNDNFFELGGHSLLAIQVMNKARSVGLELDIQQIFMNQTIAELAVAAGGAAVGDVELSKEEAALSEIWKELLGLESIGVQDNFFELGGHSLLAIQVMNKARAAGLELDIQQIFMNQTVAELAIAAGGEKAQTVEPSAEIEPPVAGTVTDSAHIERLSEERCFPVTFTERRFWFLSQFHAGAPIYNIVWGYTIRGMLQMERLTECVNRIAERHDMLRSTYAFEDGEPVRLVADPAPVEVPLFDFRGKEAERIEAQRVEASSPFDLEQGPVWSVSVYQVADEEFQLVWKIHHIISDGWSGGVFLTELQELYGAAVEAREAELPELPIRYGDFAAWQRKAYDSGLMDELSSYWKQKLDGFQTLEIPHDRSRGAAQTHAGATVELNIPPELEAKIRALGQSMDMTPFMTMLAAFKVVLAGYSGQDDIMVGTPVANRSPQPTEPLIGLFLNTAVLRTDLSGGITFREAMTRVRTTSLEAFSHQDLPFERVVDLLNVARDTSLPPLFQVMFSVNNFPYPKLRLGDLEMEETEIKSGLAQNDLWVMLDDVGTGLIGGAEYNTDLFDEATIQRMLNHFVNVLAEGCANPDVPLSKLCLLSEAEQQVVLKEWNATEVDYPRAACTHQLIEQQAARVPEKTALLFEGTEISYAQMNERANRLAHLLIAKGVAADQKVCVCLERGPELVIAELAIWKAGGAYVPLDPIYPPDRLNYMMEDSDAILLITQSDLELASSSPAICLDQLDLSEQSVENPAVEVASKNLAYMIYTSGSTGKPKGVQIEHQAFVNFLLSMQQRPGLTEEDTLLAITTPCFDIAGLELYLPLITGARVAILPQETTLDGTKLAEQIETVGTALQATPATWRILLNSGWKGATHLKMMCGGEGWPRELADALLQGGGELWNMYGPTETTVWSSVEQVKLGDSGAISIGKPIANTSFYILDEALKPVPVGVSGALWIGGEGLSRGYYKRDELTDTVFVADPFRPGARMYKTGDLAKWLPDGRVECQGRVDFQVKVRGFRIELEEIEKVMQQHPSVKQAVANAYKAADGENQLAGYFQSEAGQQVELPELRALLKEHLPDYMVPLAFMEMDMIPLTPNGKVNRKALPEPGAEAVQASAEYMAPRNAVEQTLVEIWCEVLHQDRVGVKDNFFEIGGHSLLLIQVLNKAREAGLALDLQEMFQFQTIAEHAATMELGAPQEAVMPQIERVDSDTEFPVSFTEQRFWFLSQMADLGASYNITHSYDVTGAVDVALFSRCVHQLVERHDVLRSVYQFTDETLMRLVRSPLPDGSDLQVVEGAEEDLDAWCREESARPFDLTEGPLWRMALYGMPNERWRMVFTIHHIISDGESCNLYMQELLELYAAASERREARLPELLVRYGDYAAWQHAQFEQGEWQDSTAYWARQLAGIQTLTMPHDRPRPNVQTYAGALHSFAFSAELESALKRRCREEGVTPYMFLLAAFNWLLSAYSGQDDIVVGTPVANRSPAETEPVLGVFLNTVALRTDLSGNPEFSELLARVKTVALEGFQHQAIPFDRVVELLDISRDTGLPPVYQAMFSLNQYQALDMKLGHLEMTGAPVDNGLAMNDLWLSVDDLGAGLFGYLSYNTDLFDEETMTRFCESYVHVLETVCAAPRMKKSELIVMPDDEKERILTEWSGSVSAYEREATIAELFEQQVAATPEMIAVELPDGAGFMSYDSLNRKANRLAQELITLGVKTGDYVGLCFTRSPDMVIAILAILKAGAAYVPLEASYPTERIKLIMDDTKMQLALCCATLVARLPEHKSCQRLIYEKLMVQCKLYDDENPVRSGHAGYPAYVMFTSGTTGKPKGVVVPNRAVVRLVRNTNYVKLGGDTKTLHFAPIAFDASTFEIWAPLLNGGCVVLYPAEHPTLDLLGNVIWKSGVNTLFMTAELFRAVVDERIEILSGVKQLIAGGDVLPMAEVLRMRKELPECQLINGYGPTENTTFSTFYPIEETRALGETVPIGYPLANSSVYILDEYFKPVPVGVSGDLYTGGDGLALGYLNRAALTKQAFVENPFGAGKIYATGDRARWRADGAIEFLGRGDRQIKIRGYRIELDGIETVLGQHPALAQVAVVAAEWKADQRALVAYFSVDAGATVSTEELRGWLAQQLPDYMLPQHWQQLDVLPVSATGKIARSLLPAVEFEPEESGFVEPRNAEERSLSQIWRDVLQIEKIGVHDNFFELGGNSLIAIKLIMRMEEAGYSLRVEQLFQYPTVATMAPILSSNFAVESDDLKWSSLVRLKQGNPAKVPLFFVHTAPGDVLIYSNLIHHLKYDQPCYGFQSLGLHDVENVHGSIEEMARHYVELLKEFYPKGPYMLAGWCYGGTVAAEMATQLKEQGADVRLLALFDAWAHNPADDAIRKKFTLNRIRSFCTMSLSAQCRFVMKRVRNRLEVARKTDVKRDLEVEVTKGVLKNRDEVYRRNMTANWNYYSRYYPGTIKLFCPDLLNPDFIPDFSMGWHLLADDYDVFMVPGDHRAVMHDPNVQILSKHLQQCIDESGG